MLPKGKNTLLILKNVLGRYQLEYLDSCRCMYTVKFAHAI